MPAQPDPWDESGVGYVNAMPSRPGCEIGGQGGLHYALGYNGSGGAMAPYLGWRVANKVLGTAEGRSALDALPFRRWQVAPALRALMPMASLWHCLKNLRDGS